MATPRAKGRAYLEKEAARRKSTGEGSKGLGPRGRALMDEAGRSNEAKQIVNRQVYERTPEGNVRRGRRSGLQPDERRD